jgi:hypothetical protein
MRRALLVVAAIFTLLVGAAAGIAVAIGLGVDSLTATETITSTTTSTATETETATEGGLPPAVEATRAALLAAAESGDYEQLRPHIPASGFEYTFGGPVEGGPIGYWQELERTTDERPLETLATVLELPYTLSHGIYVWPFAYSLTSAGDLTKYEKTLLAPLGNLERLFAPGTGYLGWRAGIDADGSWVFFVAGD